MIYEMRVMAPVAAMAFLAGTLNLSPAFSAQPSPQISAVNGLPAEVLTTIDSLAKDLAALLADKHVRNQLRVAINNSTKREKIVFLDEFLASADKDPALPDQARGKAQGLLKKATAAKKRFREPEIKKTLIQPEIEVYFPARNHRDKWTGGDDVLVAVGTLDDSVSQIKVYSAKTQQDKLISADVPPEEPVLVVVPSEHASYEVDPILEDRDLPKVKPAAPPQGNQSYKLTNFFYISTTSESWLMGDPEIYVWVAQANAGRQLTTAKKYLPGVNDAGRWKDLTNCPTALGMYWDAGYDPVTYFKVMEEDGGSMYETPVTAAYGGFSLSFTLKIANGDDDMGSVTIDRNGVGWCPSGVVASCCQSWTSQWSTGKAQMRMTLAH